MVSEAVFTIPGTVAALERQTITTTAQPAAQTNVVQSLGKVGFYRKD